MRGVCILQPLTGRVEVVACRMDSRQRSGGDAKDDDMFRWICTCLRVQEELAVSVGSFRVCRCRLFC